MSEETHQAILKAVPRLLARMRYTEVTFDRIAEEAGVGKAAIFRRWESKAALVTDAVRQLFESSNPSVSRTGNVRTDIRAFVRNTAAMLRDTPAGAVIRSLISELAHEPRLSRLIADLEKERRKLILELLSPLDARIDRNQLIATMFGPLYFRWLVQQEAVGDRFAEACVDWALSAAEASIRGARAR